MIIYKIVNNINDKIYIGQTVNGLKKRWNGHVGDCSRNKNNHPLYNAMKKYGVENFFIEEIGGANSLSELNYQEWFLVHKNNTLWPNGYNMIEGGGSKGKLSETSRKRISKAQKKYFKTNPPIGSKAVINIETGERYSSCSDCARKNGLNSTGLSAKLLGKAGNQTSFRYVGMEGVCKRYHEKHERKGQSKKVVNIKTGETWDSAKICWKNESLKITHSAFKSKLNGISGNDTDFRYLGEENKAKKFVGNVFINSSKKVIDTKTNIVYNSVAEAERENGIKKSFLKDRLNKKVKHTEETVRFKYCRVIG